MKKAAALTQEEEDTEFFDHRFYENKSYKKENVNPPGSFRASLRPEQDFPCEGTSM